jgi:hypothetical protein
MVILKAEKAIGPSIIDFKAYIKSAKLQPIRSDNELILEALTLGVFWRVYSDTVLGLNSVFRNILTAVSKTRANHKQVTSVMDVLKGITMTLALSFRSDQKISPAVPAAEQLRELLLWLEAFGDFEQEVKRLNDWVEFLFRCNQSDSVGHLNSIIEFTKWFELEAQMHLKDYTKNVEKFIKEKESHYRWREDRIFCLRKPVEYHLNMVGARLLSIEYQKEFINSTEKKVLLPACMRSHSGNKCMAVPHSLGSVCSKCTLGCIVNTITGLGDKNGYKVYIISHESSAFSGSDSGGIVGVSCVTRLIEGGWKAKELGLPPQCVLLDYCGCKKHWDADGIPTTLNISELNKIMQASSGKMR